ncbi:helix-turn-helix domain-containing protein [Lactobacillus gasseri]|jgi:transcriptional regulator with XRE-family HTH domain|uniref:Transcriptional regulator n=1 Tax=Lactobacillus gasseri TaxID=1596 RepID=A0AB33CAD9_LACGS|nr:helix-turn-helix transcriptional regulator [Lactobacillus gasseri]ART99219.1 transcriptional regulator [Lactobacillus gasseri]
MPLEEKLEQAKQALTIAIKKKMLEKGWSQAELAETLQLNRGVVSRAINGDANPQSIETRKKIYKILEMEGE